MRNALIAATAFVLLAGCAPSAAQRQRIAERDARTQARLETRLAGYTPGKPQNCLDTTLAQDTERFGSTILYKNGNTIYRNDTIGGCDFDRDSVIVTKTFSSQLCSGDIVRLVDRTSHMLDGSCGFGSFVPYRK